MSYLGRRGASAALTSADIPDDSITAAKIVDGAVTSDLVYLENKATTQNLTGTYSTERMYLNDSYTLTGDVTVTGHLALGSIADEDIVITQDSTERTITGSGTLESGNVLQADTHRTSVTGMTGELGSVVTGSPNLNLANATFPAGHVIQTVHNHSSSQFDIPAFSAGAFATSGFSCPITPKSTTSKILFTFDGGFGATSSADNWFFMGVVVTGSSITTTNIGIDAVNPLVRANPNTSDSFGIGALTANFLHDYNQSNTTDALTFTIHLGSQAAYSAGVMHLGGRNNGESRYSMMTLMEIAQ